MSDKDKVGKELYNDLIKPSATALGETLSVIPRIIRIKLQPIEKWLRQEEHNYEKTMDLLAKKLEKADPEQLETPEAHIAVPALQYLSYCMDNEELREMYANLLANSMHKAVKNGVHPAYVEIIKQLCPDEAKLLRELYMHKCVPVISVWYLDAKGAGNCYLEDFSDVGERAECEYPYELRRYFDNLIRLGLLVRSVPPARLANEEGYERLRKHPKVEVVEKEFERYKKMYSRINYEKGYIELSEFGKAFCGICLRNKGADILCGARIKEMLDRFKR